jgi:transcriptional regulator with XRE-family HTH domain
MINRIERGVAAPSFETLEKFSRVLKTPVRDFFGTGNYSVSPRRDDPLQQLIERISGLDSDDMKWVQGLVSHALKRKVRSG